VTKEWLVRTMDEGKKKLDFYVNIGPNCQVTYWMKKCDLYTCATPLDWQLMKQWDSLIHLFQTRFMDFFMELEESKTKTPPEESPHRIVYDMKNDIYCMHYFPKSESVDEAKKDFLRVMRVRYVRMVNHLRKAEKIGLIGTWNVDHDQLCLFLRQFAEIYPGKEIALINVHDVSGAEGVRRVYTQVEPGLCLDQYFFDNHVVQSEEAWIGNEIGWRKALGGYCLSNKGI